MNIKEIEEKKRKLTEVSQILKDKFIGIDDVIDRLIDSISLWYIMPELQLRPPIVALWGITGIGKTDLIRTLVKHLGFNDKFIEIQMDDIDKHYNNSIEEHLEDGGIEPNIPAILLLDEIQRYRTVDETGKMINNKSYSDIWSLLSDGKFQNSAKRKHDLLEMFYDELYNNDRGNNDDDDQDEIKSDKETTDKNQKKSKDYLYQLSFWSAKRLKKVLKISTPINELMLLKTEDKIDLIKSTLNNEDISVGSNYNKLLIIVSGNLDEAFQMSFDVSDVDSDADIFHENSKKINILNIKNALLQRFKPEQIARFGNNHIIYPLLSKDNYKNIIYKYSQEILDKVESEHNVNIKLSDKIYDIIYTNGVFPAQGVRPTISTIYGILGNNIPHFLFNTILNNETNIVIDYDKSNNELFSNIKNTRYHKSVVLDIDNIKKDKSIDEKRLVMVHEIGHALVYSSLFKIAPKQINIDSIGFSAGFIITHRGIDNKTSIKNKIATMVAGMVAEELVFGDDYKSTGCYGDIQNATTLASKYVRKYNMDGTISSIERTNVIMDDVESNYDIDNSNIIIEHILSEEKKNAKNIILEKINIFKELIDFASTHNALTIVDFVRICNDNDLVVGMPVETNYNYNYTDKVNLFLKNNN